LRRKNALLLGLLVFTLATAWFGYNLISFTIDYKDEMVSLRSFEVSITGVKAEENHSIVVVATLNNSYSRDLVIDLLSFNVFQMTGNTLLTTGTIDYTSHGEYLRLPAHSEHTEEFTGEPLIQIGSGIEVEVEVQVKVMIRTQYFGESIREAEANSNVTFY
jgi:hypothetical protein